MTLPLSFSAEVSEARANNTPIVALESTIITHGMPYPQNIETAKKVEATVRAEGVTPATIAVMDHSIKIGLEEGELDALGQAQNVAKLSRADLAHYVATGNTGATTVAATMICAHLAGIEVFATGGIGGVHRGASDTFDVSADLQELSRTPVTVVSAGPKALLDIPKTLEVLETLGVPVIAFGQEELPAFWSRRSHLKAPLRLDSAKDIARTIAMRKTLKLSGGHLIANPIPKASEIPAEDLAPIIAQATTEAETQGITGKAVTPFLLDRIFELTEGRSLTANIALVLNNAKLAAKIAISLQSEARNT